LNVAVWPEHRQTMTQRASMFRRTSQQSVFLKTSFALGHPHTGLYSHYRTFYWECRALFPALPAANTPVVVEGDGLWPSNPRGGEVLAWAHQTAHLRLRVPAAGRYTLEASVLLRPAESLAVVLHGERRLEVPRNGGTPGPERFSVPLDLPAGETEIELRSSLPEIELDPSRKQHGSFGLFLPAALRERAEKRGDPRREPPLWSD